MMLLAALIALLSRQADPTLPLQHIWTITDPEQSDDVILGQKNLFYIQGNPVHAKAIVAADAQTGEIRWTQNFALPIHADWDLKLSAQGDEIVVAASARPPGTTYQVWTFDQATGTRKRYERGPGSVEAIVPDGIFVHIQRDLVQFNSKAKGPDWTLPIYPDYDMKASEADGDYVVYSMQRTTSGGTMTLLGVDGQTGKINWRRSDAGTANDYYPPQVMHGRFLAKPHTDPGMLLCIDASNGKTLWKRKGDIGVATLTADALWVAEDVFKGEEQSSILRRLDPATGNQLWSVPMDQPVSDTVAFPGNGIIVIGAQTPHAFTTSGKFLWEWPATNDRLFNEGFIDDNFIVINHGYAMGYRPGVAPGPTNGSNSALAQQMADRFESLDSKERQHLATVGPDAFEPMLGVLDRLEKSHGPDNWSGIVSALDILDKTMTPENAPKLIDYLERSDKNSSTGYFGYVIGMLVHFKNAKLLGPFFKDVVQRTGWPLPERRFGVPSDKPERAAYALEGWLHSDDPDAIAFGEKVLNDPHTQDLYKASAYTNLAASGSPEAAKIVVALRNKPGAGPGWSPKDETENVMQVAFEARFHFPVSVDSEFAITSGPATMQLPNDMSPLKFSGWNGTIKFVKGDAPPDEGKPFLAFGEYSKTANGDSAGVADKKARVVKWGADRNSATVIVYASTGMHNFDSFEMDLRKFGTQWVVVGMKLLSSFP